MRRPFGQKSVPISAIFNLILCVTVLANSKTVSAGDAGLLTTTLTNTRNYLLTKRKIDHWSEPLVMSVTNDAVSLVLAKKLGKLEPPFLSDVLASIQARMESSDGWPASPGGPTDENVTDITLLCLDAVGVPKTDSRFAGAWKQFDQRGGIKNISVFTSFMLSPLGLIPKHQALPSTPKILASSGMLKKMGAMLDGYLVPYAAYSYFKKLADNALIKDQKTSVEWRALDKDAVVAEGYPAHRRHRHDGGDEDPYANLDEGFFAHGVLKIGVDIINVTSPGSKVFWAEQILSRTLNQRNKDGGWYGIYFSTVALEMLKEAERVGLGDFSQEIDQGWSAYLRMRAAGVDKLVVQSGINTGNWDTSSIFNAFQGLQNSKLQLSETEQTETTDWFLDRAAISQDLSEMAWGFDETDVMYPDVDTTANVIESLALSPTLDQDRVNEAIQAGLKWILNHQNKDGGFPVWTKGNSSFVAFISNMLFKDFSVIDKSQADITGRVLHAFQILEPDAGPLEPRLQKARAAACHYLSSMPKVQKIAVRLQPGNWMANYTYSASNLLIGLASGDCNHAEQEQALSWLQSVQKDDGGWGESYFSYKLKSYEPGMTTISQTGVVLMGLITYAEAELRDGRPLSSSLKNSIGRGIDFLIGRSRQGLRPFETDFTYVVMKGVYARYELAPAYIILYTLGHWQNILTAAGENAP